jgi:septum formation protein
MTRVVLGSASPGRRKVLRQAGIDPVVAVSDVDEDDLVAGMEPGASPAAVTTALAVAKAENVVGRLEPALSADCVVIACDSMLYIEGELRGKPRSAAAARQGWQQMAGRTGRLFTGHCLIRLQDNTITHRLIDSTATAVRFATPSEEDLRAYIDSGEPLAVAGAFTIDGLGGWFVEGVDGDPSAVVGIALPTTRRLFERAGLSLAQLWRTNSVRS